MGSTSILHWLVVGLIVLLLFGRGRLPGLMADVAKGIKSFRTGLREDDPEVPPANPAAQNAQAQSPQSPSPQVQNQQAAGVADEHKTRA